MTRRRPRVIPGQLVLPGLRAGGRRRLLHVTVADFPLAVELRRRPELRRRAVVVVLPGGAQGRRAVLSVSPEARKLGCAPGGAISHVDRGGVVVLPLDRSACRAAAREVAAALRTVPGDWTVDGWGEATLMPVTDDPGPVAALIQRRLFAGTGFPCAVGIGGNVLQARLAARLAAPGDVIELDAAHWLERVGPLPPDVLTGIGPRRRERLHELGLERVDDLASADEAVLAAAFGPSLGPQLRRTARGRDRSRTGGSLS